VLGGVVPVGLYSVLEAYMKFDDDVETYTHGLCGEYTIPLSSKQGFHPATLETCFRHFLTLYKYAFTFSTKPLYKDFPCEPRNKPAFTSFGPFAGV
jgi:hypothetical protein